jgi:hypothetical protein
MFLFGGIGKKLVRGAGPRSLSGLRDDRERKPTLARIVAAVNALEATYLWHRGDGLSVLVCNVLQAVLV